MLFSPQIPLPLEPRHESRFSNFVAGPNAALVQAVRFLHQEPAVSLYLQGGESSGKTHLLNAACLAERDAGRTAFYAGLRSMPRDSWATLEDLEGMDLVCVDDLDVVAGEASWEEALFHLYNRLREANAKLLVASRVALAALPLRLPDLQSRLASGLRLQLQMLDEASKLQVLQRYAEASGVQLPEEVGQYLLSRGHRSLAALLPVIDRLQQAALSSKRRVTLPLAREILQG